MSGVFDKTRSHKSPITCFPTSLMVCELVVKPDLDLSSLTNLTSTRVELHYTVQLEFPTQLKELGVDDALQLGRTKMSRVQLDCFECFGSNHSVTEEVLWMHLNCVFCVTRTAVKTVLFRVTVKSPQSRCVSLDVRGEVAWLFFIAKKFMIWLRLLFDGLSCGMESHCSVVLRS